MAEPQPIDQSDKGIAISLALLQERLGVLMATVKDNEDRSERWRGHTTLSITSLSGDVTSLKTESQLLSDKIKSMETEIHQKVSSGYFSISWKIAGGIGFIILVAGSVVSALHLIH